MTKAIGQVVHGVDRTEGLFSSDSAPSAKAPAVRTIHYLGSKLRLLRSIGDAVAQVAPVGATVCDLFAGSGTVSIFLGSRWNVVAADVQEYSRVLCNGLLKPPPTISERATVGSDLVQRARSSPLRHALRESLAGLVDYERDCAVDAAAGNTDRLCDLMECPPLISGASDEELQGPLGSLCRAARDDLVMRGLGDQVGSVMSTYFGGVYFSWRQAADFDALLAQIHRMDPIYRDYYLACALAAASDVVNTVGKHFAQRARPRKADGVVKVGVIGNALKDRSKDAFSAFLANIGRLNTVRSEQLQHHAVRRDFRDLLDDPGVRFDVLYADPPYTRDHYSRYYHVLETMARHDRPGISSTRIRSEGKARLSRGVYRRDRHQSPFCIHSRARDAFHLLAAGAAKRGVPLVLSYSPYDESAGHRPRVLTASELLETLKQYFSIIDVREIPNVAHSKLNLVERNVSVAGTAEMLIVCRR